LPRLWAHFGSLALVFTGLAVWSWRKWADVFIDYGMDLYIPWQLAEGRRLYSDISWLHGPLAQYFNALLFKLTGPSITTLIVADLAITALLTLLLHQIFAFLFDRRTAFTVCIVFLTVFAFSQYTRMGSFNYIAPYRHEQTHGTVLAVAMVYCLFRLVQQRRMLWAGLAGLCLGLVALTKMEIMLAAGVAAVAALMITAVFKIDSVRNTLRNFAVLSGAALVPPAVSILMMSTWLSWTLAFQKTFANISLTRQYPVLDEGFYRYVTGLDAPRAHAFRMLELTVVFVLLLAIVIAVQVWTSHKRLFQSRLHLIVLGLLTFSAAVLPRTIPWDEIGLLLPGAMAVIILIAARALIRERKDSPRRNQLAGLIIWSVFSLGMMAKTMLNVRLYHYGFTLAMPAAMLLVAVCVTSIPNLAGHWARSQSLVRAVTIALIAAGCAFHLNWSNGFYGSKTLAVGAGGDEILTYPYSVEPAGELMRRTMEEIERSTPPDATVLVMPQGITLNYLTRRFNGTPYWSFHPFDIKISGGERQMLGVMQSHPPDYVVLIDNGVPDFEGGFFGGAPESGKMMMEWLSQSYYQTWTVGNAPFVNGRPGALMLKRFPQSVPN